MSDSQSDTKHDLTYGVNPHQSVKGMVAEYEAKEARKDAAMHDPDATDIPKEEMEPSREGERLVSRGRLNPVDGQEIPLTSKARTAAIKAFCPSPEYLSNFDSICWD